VSELLRVYELSECGPDGYPPAWHESVKDLVRELAGHRCVRCGHPYRKGEHGTGEWSPCDERCTHRDRAGDWCFGRGDEPLARWRILTVHHLTGNKADLRWWNLAALCQRCHLQIQGRVRMEQVYPYEHSDWFKPYAAGYYAATYLGEDLTREETVTRLDELLGLERVA
jgi:hypothetical protein